MKPYHTWSGEERAAFYAALVKRINNPDYFSSRIGVRITEIQEGEAWGELLADEGNCNSMGIVHGGCLYTLADTVCGMTAFSRGNSCTPASATLDYLRPGRIGKRILCHGKAQKMGHTLTVVQVSITEESGLVLATGLYTFCTMAPLNWNGETIAD